MPDISMCLNYLCPSAQKCYRYMTLVGVNQSYVEFAPKKSRVKCDHYIKYEVRQ